MRDRGDDRPVGAAPLSLDRLAALLKLLEDADVAHKRMFAPGDHGGADPMGAMGVGMGMGMGSGAQDALADSYNELLQQGQLLWAPLPVPTPADAAVDAAAAVAAPSMMPLPLARAQAQAPSMALESTGAGDAALG